MLEIKKKLSAQPKGIYSIPNHVYHSSAGISRSQLASILQCPAKFYERELNPQGAAHAAALVIGTALHSLVLEGEAGFKRDIAVCDVQKRVGKTYYATVDENPGKEILLTKELEIVEGMYDAIYSNSAAVELLDGCMPELSFYSKIKGVLGKARPDALFTSSRKFKDPFFEGYRSRGYIVDLKTTADASFDGFRHSLLKYNYFLQPGWYIDICNQELHEKKIEDFFFLCVEKEPPHIVSIYKVPQRLIEYGRKKYQEAIFLYQKCKTTGQWDGYQESIQTLDLPEWLYNKENKKELFT